MKSKNFWWMAWVVVLAVAQSIGAAAEEHHAVVLSGFINDYSAKSVSPVGHWEVRGTWRMVIKPSGKADFSATFTMVRSDYWVIAQGDPDQPEGRVPHTHHLKVEDADVTTLQNGIQVDGPAEIMANGSPAGFSPSVVHIKVTGGTSVEFSNIQLTFDSPASGHFGTDPLEGVVRRNSSQ